MNLNDYIKLAINTESIIEEVKVNPRLNHGIMGIVTEVGELLEPFMDEENSPWVHIVNIKEEIGDILWYLAIIMDEMSLNYDDIEIVESEDSFCNTYVCNLVIEASRLQDDLKKHIYYGNDLDYNLLESRIAIIVLNLRSIAKELDFTLEEVAETNINKLKARYPNKFTSEDALSRDLDAEYKILEGK